MVVAAKVLKRAARRRKHASTGDDGDQEIWHLLVGIRE